MPTLDEAFDVTFGGAKPSPAPSLDAAVDRTFQPEDPKLRANLYTAVRTDPVTTARADDLAKEIGLPTDMVARNLMNVELQRAVEKADAKLQTDPALLKRFRESDLFAKKARDDIDALIATHGELKAWKGPEPTAANVVRGLIQSVPQGFESVRQGLGAQMSDFLEWTGLLKPDEVYKANQARKLAQAQGAREFTTPAFESGTAEAIYGGVDSTLRMIPGLAASLLTRSPTPALAAAGLQSQAEAYGKYRTRGGKPLESFIGATGEGAVEVATEMLPTKFLTSYLGKKGVGEFMTGLLARELPSEQVATLLQDAIDTAVANPNKTWGEYLAERPEAIYKTFVATLTQSAIMGGLSAAVARVSGEDIRIRQAQEDAQRLQAAFDAAAKIKMREHSPRDLADALQSLVVEGGTAPKSIFVDTEVFAQATQGMDLAELEKAFPTLAQQLPDAMATPGSFIELPTGDVIAAAPAGSPLSEFFAQNSKTSPYGMSLVEAEQASKQAEQFLQQEADRVLEQAADTAAWQQSSQAVQQTILDQLNTAGRFTPDVNEAYATLQANFFSTMAARVGLTPQELYERYQLRVSARQPGGQVLATLDQGEVEVTDQVDEATGLPLNSDGTVTLYHHTSAANAEAIRQSGALRSAGEPDVYMTTREVPDTGYGDTVVKVRIDPAKLQLDDEFPDGRMDFRVSVGRPGGSLTDAQFNQSATIRRGTETLRKYGLKPGKSYKTREVAAALEARQRAKYGTIAADDRSPEALAKIAKWMQAEVEFAMDNPESSGVGWYSEKFQRALDTMAQAFPELATDKVARDTMTALIAITSDGQKVVPNFAQAMDIYGRFREGGETAGKFTTTRGHQRQASIDNNLAVLQRLYDQMGAEAMHEYLMQEKTISELKKLAKANGGDLKSDYQAHIKMPMAAVEFGPKLGAFYANLMGAHGYLTMDRGWSRTFNRYRGTLLQAPTRQGLDRFKELLGNPAMSDDEAIAATVEPRNAYEAKGFKNGTELEKAANTIYKAAFENLEDSPFNATDRTFMLDAVNKAQQALKRKGYNLSVADIQAILWYYEKRLYGELGARQTADISYEEAAQRVVAGYASGSGIESLLDDTEAAPEDGGADQGRVPVGEETFNAGDVNGELEQARDRAGRAAGAGPAPLPGAPVIEGATGPDPRLVAVAEQYARDNGIDLKRQAEYVQVDPERAARIAQAYDEMQHAPNDPAVREAYQNLIQQTVAQYRALEAAGYRFWFIDPENDPYKSPWDAMREMRASQTMGVFPTVAGFGSGATDVDISDNPLMGDTGIQWPYGSLDGEMKPVLANDLFRAVHDAFGHGLEGAGFRAQGEENAWQAHIRLFTGSAKGAITSETRGQNSWLNFGPYGETNRTAKVEDTVFADQKTGLMPEWTWTEGLAPDMQEQGGELAQGPRGTFSPEQLLVTLNENADLSTFLHESGHFFLEVLADLASQSDTPQQIRDDMKAVLQWFGVRSLATWNQMTLDEKRPYHERWAESFEQYLFEGKAPSPELQPLFRRFRSWLVNVYQSLTAFMRGRNLRVSDEIRQVFDRMVATDEQIAQAEEAAGMLPDFEATNEAIEALQARSLRDLKWTIKARSKALKALEKEAATLRKEVEAEVRAEVEQQPLYKAMNWLKKGETTDPATGDLIKAEKGYRLSTAALAEMYPETMLGRPDLTRLRGMTGKEGLHPDMVADMFGFESGDQLVRAILDAEPIASVIEGITDQRMLERHGDLATPEAREAAANEAVHNEARARSLATELKAQADMMNQRQDTGRTATNGRAITVNAVVEAAKQFALNLAARRRLKDLKNAAWQHRSAEARAGKRWQQLTAEGKTEEAVQAKRDQLLNNYAAKALQDAQVEVRKTLEFFKRITKGSDEKIVERGRDPDVVNAMRAILAAYDVAPRLEKSALAYMEVVAKNDPAMYSALKPGVDAALLNAKPLTEMTLEELRGLNDELRAMWVLAKRSRQMEVDGNLLDIEEAADELVTRMDEIGIPVEIPGERGAITDKQEAGIKLRFALSILTRVEQWAERLDGRFGGPFLRLVFQPVKDAADRYRTDKVAYRKQFVQLLETVKPFLPAGPIAAPELGYTFGNARDSGAAELLHAILHTGNDSNKRKLLLGRGWATENADGTIDTTRWDAFIERLQNDGVLVKEHYDFAQGVWDLLEQMKPLAQETHRKVFGRYFAEVTANEVVTPFGTYRGGYVPAQTDSRLVKDAKLRELAEGENESMAYAFPAAPSGFTKSRVEYNQPLLLDLRALSQHMDKVLLFSHMQGAVTDVRRLLTNKRVSYALDRIDPGAYEGMLIPWLNRAAKQVVETPVVGDRKLSRFLSAARSRAGMALMFANLSNTFQQITGFSMAAVKVKPGLMLQATAAFIADPKGIKRTVAEASPYMKDRMLNEVSAMNDAVEEILVNPTLLQQGQAWTQRHAYFMQAAVDNTMSPIIWTAAYNQATAEGQNERDAVRFADSVVRQTQGTTLPEDVSRFESGPGYARLFTQFVSYFNMMANTNATAVSQIVGEMGLRKGAGRLLYVALAGLLVPIWVAEAIAQAFRGGPEDEEGDGWLDDWLMAVFGLGTIRGLVAQVPIAGQAAQLVVNRFNDNPADDKFSLSPAVSLIESAVSSPASVYKAVVDGGSAQKAVRDVATAATLITGLPIFTVGRPLGYLAGLADDRIEPTGPVDLARGLVTGTASPESKAR